MVSAPGPLPTPIEKQVVSTPDGEPETIEEARANLIEARLMGTQNLFGLHRERTALEALVSELRK